MLNVILKIPLLISVYLQSVLVHSASCVNIYTMVGALLLLIDTKPVVACGEETYNLNLRD
jgi:hypothetical protein